MNLRDAVKPLNQVLKARGLGFDSLHNLSQPEHWRRGGTGDLLLVGHIVHPPEQGSIASRSRSIVPFTRFRRSLSVNSFAIGLPPIACNPAM